MAAQPPFPEFDLSGQQSIEMRRSISTRSERSRYSPLHISPSGNLFIGYPHNEKQKRERVRPMRNWEISRSPDAVPDSSWQAAQGAPNETLEAGSLCTLTYRSPHSTWAVVHGTTGTDQDQRRRRLRWWPFRFGNSGSSR